MTRHVQKVDLEIASLVTVERYHVLRTGSHAVKVLQAWLGASPAVPQHRASY